MPATPAVPQRREAAVGDRVALWGAVAGCVATAAGFLGALLAPFAGARAGVAPSLLLAGVGITILLATALSIAVLRRADRRSDVRVGSSRTLRTASAVAAWSILGAGVLAVVFAGMLFALTGSARAALLAIPGLALTILGVALVLGAVRAKRAER